MGKKKIITKEGGEQNAEAKASSPKVSSKKKVTSVVLHVEATFNNTKVVLSDKQGNTIFWTSAGALGLKGEKKGTPFAASKAGEVLAEKAANIGVKDFSAVIKGVGSGREGAIRAFMAKGFELTEVKDVTPVPHNGPKPKKPRRV